MSGFILLAGFILAAVLAYKTAQHITNKKIKGGKKMEDKRYDFPMKNRKRRERRAKEKMYDKDYRHFHGAKPNKNLSKNIRRDLYVAQITLNFFILRLRVKNTLGLFSFA